MTPSSAVQGSPRLDMVTVMNPCSKTRTPNGGPRAIEDAFPFEFVNDIAEMESWRKEIHRPIYHVHKWWAQRLGSVFRAAIIAAALPQGTCVADAFYKRLRLSNLVVFDPFMGSGTTIGEATKLGCTAIGRDINPVAHRMVRVALGRLNRTDLHMHFKQVEETAGHTIQSLYRTADGDGQPSTALYFFWVKVLPCPGCGEPVDLFPTYIFASHADKVRHPRAKAVCPGCGAVVDCRHDATSVACDCGTCFDPRTGPARRTNAVCKRCAFEFPIAQTAAKAHEPPAHRMYAKLVLRSDGTKEYLPVDDDDLLAYQRAAVRLSEAAPPIPTARIKDGHNTRQLLNYGYRSWYEMFNARQLLALTTLATSIQQLPRGDARNALSLLFSGVLEFNNMFASYKGEGTGAVRHLFSHHILSPSECRLKPTSGVRRRARGPSPRCTERGLMRAVDYREAPFEIDIERGQRRRSSKKIFGLSDPIGTHVFDKYQSSAEDACVVLSCGDSAATDLPTGCVDLVVTDPPFFDNVHYSELADFFFAWQKLYFPTPETRSVTTRRSEEVQDAHPEEFSRKLQRVLVECHRVLRDDGLLVLSYHHSRESGWTAVAEAILGAGFSIVQSHPVKAEMSVAAPKSKAKQPIDLDVLIVCRKKDRDTRRQLSHQMVLSAAEEVGEERIRRFNAAGRTLSRNDVRVVILSQLIVELSAGRSANDVCKGLGALLQLADERVETLWRKQAVRDKTVPSRRELDQTLPFELT